MKIFGRPDVDSSHDTVNLSYPDIAADLKVGDDILFDDGELDMKVVDIQVLCSWLRCRTREHWGLTRA